MRVCGRTQGIESDLASRSEVLDHLIEIHYIAEVDVDGASGRISVTRLVASQDCGPISSPDGMKNQIEGGALQGLSRALGEAVTWDGTKVTSVDWRTYHSLSLGADMPAIESVLIDRRDKEAMGAGETTIESFAAPCVGCGGGDRGRWNRVLRLASRETRCVS